MTTGSRLPPELRGAVSADLAPVRPLPPPWRRLLLGFPVVLGSLGMPFVYFRMRDTASLGAELAWVPIAVQLLLAFTLLVIALREAIPGCQVSRLTIAGFCLLGFGIQAGVNYLIYLRSPLGVQGSSFAAWLGCFRNETLIGLPILVMVAWLAARALPQRPMAGGFMVGAGAGLAADASWRLFCPVSSPLHVLLAHSGGVLTLGLTGALLGLMWARSRSSL